VYTLVSFPLVYLLFNYLLLTVHFFIAYQLSKASGQWIRLDDTIVRRVGTLADCLVEIRSNGYQPSLLVYNNISAL